MKRISATKVHITVISQVKVSCKKKKRKKVDEIKTRLETGAFTIGKNYCRSRFKVQLFQNPSMQENGYSYYCICDFKHFYEVRKSSLPHGGI